MAALFAAHQLAIYSETLSEEELLYISADAKQAKTPVSALLDLTDTLYKFWRRIFLNVWHLVQHILSLRLSCYQVQKPAFPNAPVVPIHTVNADRFPVLPSRIDVTLFGTQT